MSSFTSDGSKRVGCDSSHAIKKQVSKEHCFRVFPASPALTSCDGQQHLSGLHHEHRCQCVDYKFGVSTDPNSVQIQNPDSLLTSCMKKKEMSLKRKGVVLLLGFPLLPLPAPLIEEQIGGHDVPTSPVFFFRIPPDSAPLPFIFFRRCATI